MRELEIEEEKRRRQAEAVTRKEQIFQQMQVLQWNELNSRMKR